MQHDHQAHCPVSESLVLLRMQGLQSASSALASVRTASSRSGQLESELGLDGPMLALKDSLMERKNFLQRRLEELEGCLEASLIVLNPAVSRSMCFHRILLLAQVGLRCV